MLPAQHWGLGPGKPEPLWVSHQVLVVIQRDGAGAGAVGEQPAGTALPGSWESVRHGPAARQPPQWLPCPGRLCFPSPAQHCAVSANTSPGSAFPRALHILLPAAPAQLCPEVMFSAGVVFTHPRQHRAGGDE